nr:NACHT domain-containing protein [Thermoflexibacter sp.]
MNTLVEHIYNPANQSREDLIDGFVVRQKTFKRIFDDLIQSDMQFPEQHFLLIGQRGMGKTTMLWRLAYAVEESPQLNSWLIPLVFPEEQYGISKLFHLWEHTARLLAQKSLIFKHLPEQMEKIYEEAENKEEYEQNALELLAESLKRQGKKALLLIDNFDEYIGKKFKDKKEVQRLRVVLSNCAELRIIGGSARLIKEFTNYGEPFYEFFKIERLEGLGREETQQLLLKLGEHYQEAAIQRIVAQQPERIEALRRITGGVIRTMVLLFEIFVESEDGSVFIDLEQILDRASPLYKHRMDDLTSEEQGVAECIALNWDSISEAEICQKTKLSAEEVKNALSALIEKFLVQAVPVELSNEIIYYQIEERFFNIWYLMRYGKFKEKNKIRWFTRFLETWASPQELRERATKLIDSMEKGTYHAKGAYYFAEAMLQTKVLGFHEEYDLYKSARTFLEKQNPSLVSELSLVNKEVYEQAKKCYEETQDLTQALAFFEEIPEREYLLGRFYDIELDFAKAEQYYLLAIEKGEYQYAPYNLAYLYHSEFKDFTKAESYYLLAIEKGDVDAPYNLAFLYANELKDFTKAEQYYLLAIEKGDVNAPNNLAILYENEFKDFAKAEQYYLLAIEKGEYQYAPYNLAYLYHSEF